MQPTSDGLNSSTVCQPTVMILCLPSQCEDTSTIGPGSRYRRTLLTGKSHFACRFMVSHEQCAGYSGAVNGFRIILRSSGQQGHRHAPAPRQAPLRGSKPTRAAICLRLMRSGSASGPQKISIETTQRCLEGTRLQRCLSALHDGEQYAGSDIEGRAPAIFATTTAPDWEIGNGRSSRVARCRGAGEWRAPPCRRPPSIFPSRFALCEWRSRRRSAR